MAISDSDLERKREENAARADARRTLARTIERMGYPIEFGAVIADSLGTEKMMRRMIAYLHEAKPKSAEEIADEMLAITSDRDRWIQKKQAEYYNAKINVLLNEGLGTEDEDIDSSEMQNFN